VTPTLGTTSDSVAAEGGAGGAHDFRGASEASELFGTTSDSLDFRGASEASELFEDPIRQRAVHYGCIP
jgi:hypothetical protein